MQKQSRWKQNEIRANLWLIIFAGIDLVRRAEISSLQVAEEMQQVATTTISQTWKMTCFNRNMHQ